MNDKMHGSKNTVDKVVRGHIEEVAVYDERRGWTGHAAKTLKKRRRRDKLAKRARKRSRD